MSPEIIALTKNFPLLFVVLLVGAYIGMAIDRFLLIGRRQVWRKKNHSHWEQKRRGRHVVTGSWISKRDPFTAKRPDAADQLRIVMGASFTVQPLPNRSESRVFKELDRIVIDHNPSWQVMAQVSLGEILRSDDAVAYSCINSKRVDLLLVDDDCQPRFAIEYQGTGHHIGTAAARDAVKKEALRRAGIGYFEVVAGQTTPLELRRLVEKLVSPKSSE